MSTLLAAFDHLRSIHSWKHAAILLTLSWGFTASLIAYQQQSLLLHALLPTTTTTTPTTPATPPLPPYPSPPTTKRAPAVRRVPRGRVSPRFAHARPARAIRSAYANCATAFLSNPSTLSPNRSARRTTIPMSASVTSTNTCIARLLSLPPWSHPHPH